MGELMNKSTGSRVIQGKSQENLITNTITNIRGYKLFSRYWNPKADPRGLVFLCHGFGEHLGWYEELAEELRDSGLLVFGHDHQGHGLSEGKRAFVESVDEFSQDVIQHCTDVKSQYPGLPMFLYGHSMGGMISVHTVLRNSSFFKGMMLEGPLIIPDPHEVTPTRLLLGRLISPLLPEMQMGRIRVEQVTSDTEMQARLNSDKLRWTGGVKLGLGLAFLTCLENMHKNLKGVSLPLLILHGENDSLCQPAGSHLLAREASSKDKRIKIFKGASHHLILEEKSIRKEVLGDIKKWIMDRLQISQSEKVTNL